MNHTMPADPHLEPSQTSPPCLGSCAEPSSPLHHGARGQGGLELEEGVLMSLQHWSSSSVAIPNPGAREGGHNLGS